jgi:hypothetical protein
VFTVTVVSVAAFWPRAALCTVNPVPVTALTEPNANPPKLPRPAPLVPLGRAEPDGRLGRVVPLPPAPRPPPPPPCPSPKAPAVQPFAVAWLMLTVRAVIGVPAVGLLVPVAVLDTVTHDPTVTSARVPLTVSENVVDELKFTVTWPLVGFCTSTLVALTAAAVPNVPGGACGPDGREVGGVDVFVLAAGVEPPPQAIRPTARAPAISARPDRTPAWRYRRRVETELDC